MDRKTKIIAFASICTLSIGAVATAVLVKNKDVLFTKATDYQITLDSTDGVTSQDNGNYHEVVKRTNRFDMLGWSAEGGNFGSIRKKTYGSYTFNGMIYNRSILNGFSSLSVNFSGGDLYYVFSEFLMENMDFDGVALTSGTPVNVPSGMAYFIVYNESTTPVYINSLTVTYTCDESIDDQMIYDENTSLGNARSMGIVSDRDHSLIELTNNPTKTTNNYSTGSHDGNRSSWFRFNGKYFTASSTLGKEFEFGMTIIGNISQVIDETSYFHYNVWPQFSYGNSADEPWVQCYIGNDNYEPLGHEHALRPDDPYVVGSYEGRFFTDYIYVDDTDDGNDKNGYWTFADPDTYTVLNGSETMREAYETYPLPFWFVKFSVYMQDDEPYCDVYINGFKVTTGNIFENYNTTTKPDVYIKTLPMHVVNYGVDIEGNPALSYKGCFTYPRLIEH